MKGLNLKFAIIRCYESLGRVDPSCADSVAAAHAAGIESVHAYMFPCPKCGNPAGQVGSIRHVSSNLATFAVSVRALLVNLTLIRVTARSIIQVGALLSYWEEHHVDVKRLWLDIEGKPPSHHWIFRSSHHHSTRVFVLRNAILVGRRCQPRVLQGTRGRLQKQQIGVRCLYVPHYCAYCKLTQLTQCRYRDPTS